MVAKLGDFLVEIDTEVNDRGIKNLTKSLGGLTTKALKFGGVLTGAVVGAGAGFVKLVKSTVEETAELGRLAEDLGTTTTFLQTFIRSFETVGATGEEAISTVRTLQKEIEAFKLGKGNIEAFGILGINPQNLGSDVARNFDVIRKRFNSLTAAQRLYFVEQVGLGEKALRVLRLTDEEYASLAETSREFPLATKKQVESARAFDRGMTRLGQSFKAFKLVLVSEVTPAFTDFVNEMIKLFASDEFRSNVSKFFSQIFDEVLPKIVKATPIIINSIGNIASSITGLIESLNKLGDNPFIKGLGNVAGGIGKAYTGIFGGIGELGADIINSQRDREALPLRDKKDIGGGFKFGVSRDDPEVQALARRAIASRNADIKIGGNDITINVPVQKLGTPITDEDRLAIKIADELDRTLKDTTENLKRGVIQ